MLYSVQDLAKYFGRDESFVYNIIHEMSMRPALQDTSDTFIKVRNYYDETQKNAIERHLDIKAQKSRKEVIYRETVYYIQPSMMNFYSEEELEIIQQEKHGKRTA